LKEGQKGDQKAKVEKVLANSKVCVLDNTKDEKGRPQAQRLVCHALAVDNAENQLNASGPGSASALQYESPGDFDQSKQSKQVKDIGKPPQLTLTRILYQGQMYSHQLDSTTRMSKFVGNVWVIRVPGTSLDMQVDYEKIPKDGLLLQCEVLTVIERRFPDGSKSQVMEAEKKVLCRTSDMTSRAEIVRFDKSQDTILLKGSPGNPASIWQRNSSQPTQAQTIQYNRKDGRIVTDGVNVISGKLTPDDPMPQSEEWIAANLLRP
jgi:hypothetical protein